MTSTEERFLYDPSAPVDPLGDAEQEAEKGTKHNRAKVGSGRPSSLLYTYGPGAIMDLPQFTVMPAGLDDWDRIWRRRDGIPHIHAPRLRDVVRLLLRSPDVQLRPHPWQPKKNVHSTEGNDLGVPARVFPQWLRCTGCDMLGGARPVRLPQHPPVPHRPGLFRAREVHRPWPARQGGPPSRRTRSLPAGLCRRPSRRVPLRPLGAPRAAVRRGGVPGVEDGRPHGRQGCLRGDRMCVLQAAQADERGAGRGRARQAAAVPGPSSASGRVRPGRVPERDPADPRRGVEPVVPGDAVGDRDARVGRRAEARPRGPGPARPGRQADQVSRQPRHASRPAGRQGRRHRSDRHGVRRAAGGGRPTPGGPRGAGEAHPRLGSGRAARPRMGLPAARPDRPASGGPGERPDAVEAGPRPEPAVRDHSGAGRRAPAQGERAGGLHPDRRHGSGGGLAAAARTPDPNSPAHVDRRHRGPRGRDLPSARRRGRRRRGRTASSAPSSGTRTGKLTAATSSTGSPRRPRRSTPTPGSGRPATGWCTPSPTP